MRLDQELPSGVISKVVIKWGGHAAGCERCKQVDIEKTATFVHACVLGSKLLMEELVARQAPAAKERTVKIENWAKKAGFKVGKPLPFTTKYVGDDAA